MFAVLIQVFLVITQMWSTLQPVARPAPYIYYETGAV